MQLTRMAGDHSAAKVRVKPSTAPLAMAMLVWYGMPVWTATVLNSTTDAFGLSLIHI